MPNLFERELLGEPMAPETWRPTPIAPFARRVVGPLMSGPTIIPSANRPAYWDYVDSG